MTVCFRVRQPVMRRGNEAEPIASSLNTSMMRNEDSGRCFKANNAYKDNAVDIYQAAVRMRNLACGQGT